MSSTWARAGSGAFSDLKERYGFVAVEDWPAACQYKGPFWYGDERDQGVSRLGNSLLYGALGM